MPTYYSTPIQLAVCAVLLTVTAACPDKPCCPPSCRGRAMHAGVHRWGWPLLKKLLRGNGWAGTLRQSSSLGVDQAAASICPSQLPTPAATYAHPSSSHLCDDCLCILLSKEEEAQLCVVLHSEKQGCPVSRVSTNGCLPKAGVVNADHTAVAYTYKPCPRCWKQELLTTKKQRLCKLCMQQTGQPAIAQGKCCH